MPWPKEPRLISKHHVRLDGVEKALGTAKYTYDINLPGMLVGKVLSSPHANARVVKIDLSKAERAPGVKAAVAVKKAGDGLPVEGTEIAAVAAETADQADDALALIEVEYEVLDHLTDYEKAYAEGRGGNPNTGGNKAQFEEAFNSAPAKIEAKYATPVRTHSCMEVHGLVAHWTGDNEVTVWCSTQNVGGVRNDIAGNFPGAQVRSITQYMGGGFGSKFSADLWGVTAARLAKMTNRPVKMMLSRHQEHLLAGNSPGGSQKYRAAANAEGKLVAIERVSYGDGYGMPPPQYTYDAPPAVYTETVGINLNAGKGRAFRAPGHPSGCFGTEQMMDELAHALKMDPVEFRVKNTGSAIRQEQLRKGAELIGWSRRSSPPGSSQGSLKRGIGVAGHTWGGGPGPNQTDVAIFPDGSVEVRAGTQDLGTGTRTVMGIVAAEALGLELGDVKVLIGDSNLPPSGGSGGSITVGGDSSGTWTACEDVLKQLFEKVAPALGAAPDALEVGVGKVQVKGNPGKSLGWKEACRKIGMAPLVGHGRSTRQGGLATDGSTGVQFAEVEVDTETGKVRIIKFVAIQEQGLVINKLACESQINSGVIMGLGWALMEHRALDPATGLMLNPNWNDYRIAGSREIPEIQVVIWDTPEVRARGVVGNGEPPVISPAGAIANAIYNAVGVRVRHFPFTPDVILAALEKEGKVA